MEVFRELIPKNKVSLHTMVSALTKEYRLGGITPCHINSGIKLVGPVIAGASLDIKRVINRIGIRDRSPVQESKIRVKPAYTVIKHYKRDVIVTIESEYLVPSPVLIILPACVPQIHI